MKSKFIPLLTALYLLISIGVAYLVFDDGAEEWLRIILLVLFTGLGGILLSLRKQYKNIASLKLKMTRADRRSQALILDAKENLQHQQEQNKILQTAIEQAELLEEVIVNANDGILITKADLINDPGPEIVYVNNALCDITGYTNDEMIGKNPRMFQGPDSSRETLDEIRECLEAGEPFKGEVINYGKNGEAYWLSIGIVPVKNSDGQVTHFAAIERDITEQKANEVELKKAVKHAEKANHTKSEFLANMSHELRTPMNGVMGMCGLLRDTALDVEQSELVQTIHHSSEDLLKLLNDILDISKVESGDVIIEKVPYNIYTAMREIELLYEATTKEKGLELSLKIEKNVPETLLGDYVKIQQIMRNLIGNAIKFTEKGSVTIAIAVHEDLFFEDSPPELYFSVKDTGIGVNEDSLEDIFQKFTQADASTTRKYGGTGLGLAITKKLVELMDGRIGVESEVGQGTIFYFSQPLELAEDNAVAVNIDTRAKTINHAALEDFSHAPLLIVDDHPINRMFAQKLLTKMGFTQLELAEDGKQALDMIAQNDYALVLMDCQMPEIDGYEATKILRKTEADGEHLPIIAVTANAMVGDKQKCLNAGMDDYLSKPLKRDALQEMLGKWLSSSTLPIETTAPQEHTTPSDESPIDLDHLSMFTDGDADEERELFEMFMQQAALNMQELRDGLEDNDDWRKAAHKFKGSAANMGAASLANSCKIAEAEFAATLDVKDKMLAEIETQLTIVANFINQRTA